MTMAHPAAAYERLSGLDNSFLLLESENTYMHIALTAVFEPASLACEGRGVDVARVRRYVASRLHLLPRYRQRLAVIPLLREPIWVDDAHFDLRYHVRHSSLPRPGTDAQLRQLCGRLLERHLDRSRPLWEMWVVEGLTGGRFAVVVKVHHCMVDGVGGIALLAALLTPEPTSEIEATAPWVARPAPSGAALLQAETARRAASTFALARRAGRALSRPDRLAALAGRRASGLVGLARNGLADGSSVFVGRTGPHRRIEWTDISFDAVRAVGSAVGGSVNDVALAVVAGAARRFLATRGVDVATASLKAAVPVSLQSSGASEAAGNQVSAWLVPLPIAERDPLRRLAAVRETTAGLKASDQAAATHVLTEIAEWTGSNSLGMTLRMLSRARPYSVIVTNIPGPPMPLYLLDARMEQAIPHLPLFDGQAIGIALLSYAGRMWWGLTGDWDLLPDLGELRSAIDAAFGELERLVAAARPAVRSPRAAGAVPGVGHVARSSAST